MMSPTACDIQCLQALNASVECSIESSFGSCMCERGRTDDATAPSRMYIEQQWSRLQNELRTMRVVSAHPARETHVAQSTSGCAMSAAYSASRRSALSALLSPMPGMSTCGGITTAAATTGPASGPRPASSTPAGLPRPWSRALYHTKQDAVLESGSTSVA